MHMSGRLDARASGSRGGVTKMTNHPNRKMPRYEVFAAGYTTEGVCGQPGDIGAAYRPHKFLGAYQTRIEAEAAVMDAQRPSRTVVGTNSTWTKVEDVYIRDRRENR